ncbi:DUF4870 domain-containing protein [Hamadaea tsunoensis]|uniref:DUF4870 domain-containing protein n=1 Tax=Hamadaea tsunoensis TaxID=53368 RepID=UPI00041A7667|nr:DUF4870 domain-containing protein [Hamadaea tsunoensis]
MSETPTPPGSSEPEPPAAPQFDAPPPPPPGGYAQAPVTGQVAPAGYASQEEKTWALVAHIGGAAAAVISGGWLGWVPPLVAMLVKGNESPTVRAHAVAALNFQGLWTVVAVLSYVLFCAFIGFLTLPIAIIIAAIFGVIAGIKANEGVLYRYPLSVNVIK